MDKIYDIFLELKTFINDNIRMLEPYYFKYKTKITANKFMYFNILKYVDNQSYDCANCNLKIENILNVSTSALIKKNSNIPFEYYEKMIPSTYEYMCNKQNVNEERILAIDGTTLNVVKSVIPEQSEKEFSTIYFSCLYDTTNELMINLTVNTICNERANFIKQLDHVHVNDIIVGDRGYYSHNLIKLLDSKNISFVMRLKCDSVLVKELKNTNKTSYSLKIDNNIIPIMLYKYIINNKQYHIACSQKLDYSIDKIKDIYHKRWKIETNFNYVKHIFNLAESKEKTLHNVMVNTYIVTYTHLICSYIRNMLSTDTTKYKIHYKNCKEIIINKLLPYIFDLCVLTKERVMCIFDIIAKTKIKNISKRSFPIKCKVPHKNINITCRKTTKIKCVTNNLDQKILIIPCKNMNINSKIMMKEKT